MLRQKLDLDTDELLAELSSPLRAEVALQRCHAFLFNPKFAAILGFDSLDATGSIGQAMFIKELVRRLRPEVLSPGETLPSRRERWVTVCTSSRAALSL